MSELKVHASACNDEPMVHTEELRSAFVRRLKEALAQAGVGDWGAGAYLAKVTGMTAKAASKWLNAETMPGRANMARIAEDLRVRVEWLQFGDGPMQGTFELRDTELEHAYQPDRTHRYPVINEVTAGEWTEICDSFTPDDTVEMQETTTDAGRCGFWLRVKNDSMTAQAGKSFPEGMLILVSPDREVLPGSFVVARVKGTNEATFKQYIQDASGHYLKPLNPSYNMIPLTDKCHFVGRVIEAKWADL